MLSAVFPISPEELRMSPTHPPNLQHQAIAAAVAAGEDVLVPVHVQDARVPAPVVAGNFYCLLFPTRITLNGYKFLETAFPGQ